MQTTSFDALLPYLVSELPGCPKVLLMQAATEVWREFCTETFCWQCEGDPLFVRENQTEYEIDFVPKCAQVAHVTKVRLFGRELRPGRDYRFSERGPAVPVLRLTCAPGRTEGKALEIKVALKPRRTATEIECSVFDDFYDAIVEGIKFRMAAQENKGWSNPGLAQRAFREFRNRMANAKIHVSRGGMGINAPMTAKPFNMVT